MAYFTASCDTVEDNTAFAKKLELDYPILSDPSQKTARAFGVLSPRGRPNRWTYIIGVDGKIKLIDRKVKSASHGEDIVKALQQAGVAKK